MCLRGEGRECKERKEVGKKGAVCSVAKKKLLIQALGAARQERRGEEHRIWDQLEETSLPPYPAGQKVGELLQLDTETGRFL